LYILYLDYITECVFFNEYCHTRSRMA
jgi:hypothetical protein